MGRYHSRVARSICGSLKQVRRDSQPHSRVISSVWQVKVLKEMRKASTESNEMKESFAATVQGIAAGMGWTG